ncbi:hypothetical protein DAPPUDRAFT_335442 [Daphnia pulex]|uniref:Uncharacterized protein n=1 Tax=Daphnia pulex TaxID=6669 RepID=E9HXT2_DAPPU|nr:hypothetical protein DAPPUDRAFT_335442 [Daphnia pulex]|eukprot:EFX63449.1 hypothetical protein DAPPUDRAFT_335442 [Daphnia pulex]
MLNEPQAPEPIRENSCEILNRWLLPRRLVEKKLSLRPRAKLKGYCPSLCSLLPMFVSRMTSGSHGKKGSITQHLVLPVYQCLETKGACPSLTFAMTCHHTRFSTLGMV